MARPSLWHIAISHYNEKARWALDIKGVDHDRHAPPPPSHIPVALWLTRGRSFTFPVLVLDGKAIGDSTAIIAALEHRYPDPHLYPADPAELARALEIEDFFDENLGAASRRLAFHEMRREPELIAQVAGDMMPGKLPENETARKLAGRGASAFTAVRYRTAGDDAAEEARAAILAAFDRLEAEMAAGPGDYLVGESFSVADLGAAAMFMPVVLPPEGPELPPPPPRYAEFRETVADRPGYRWVAEMFRRHRRGARRP
jgi:glutathione S-transferase